MNLELLDPFGRQIPDRVDATLPLAPHLHFRQPNHHLIASSPAGSGGKKADKKADKDKDSSSGNNDTSSALASSSSLLNRNSNTTNFNSQASGVLGTGLSETGGTIAGVAKRDVPEWRAAYHVSYNRRGTYVAVGYGSGAVAVHSTSSRTLAALYRSNAGGTGATSSASSGNGNGGNKAESSTGSAGAAPAGGGSGDAGGDTPDAPSKSSSSARLSPKPQQPHELIGSNGVTSLSWSRRSRTLLAGAAGDIGVLVYDTTHPFGPAEAGLAIDDRAGAPGAAGGAGDHDNENPEEGGGGGTGTGRRGRPKSVASQQGQQQQGQPGAGAGGPSGTDQDAASAMANYIPPLHSRAKTFQTHFADPAFDELKFVFVKDRLHLEAVNVPMGTRVPQHVTDSFVLPKESEFGLEPTEPPPPPVPEDSASEDEAGDGKTKRKKKRKRKKKSTDGAGRAGVGGLANIRRPLQLNKHPCISFSFQGGQKAVGGSLQINPRCPTGGLAALVDGSLVLFWFDPETAWMTQKVEPAAPLDQQTKDKKGDDKDKNSPSSPKKKKKKDLAAAAAAAAAAKQQQPTSVPPLNKKFAVVVPLWSQTNKTNKHFITCAAFDPQGERVYAATKDGTLMGFEVKLLFNALASHSPRVGDAPMVAPSSPPSTGSSNVAPSPIKGGLPLVAPHFKLSIPGGASAWHLIVSRNGKYLVLNSSDGALRLYSTQTCWTHHVTAKESRKGGSSKPSSSSATAVEKPTWTFQDVVSKVKFVSCDLSGDGEYVVGGANGNDNRYELSIWNTNTGHLMDKLTGPAVQLYSVAWHPTRANLAVASSDGLVDVWGPKLNWTAFAPDFQALQKNVIYQEGESTEEEDMDEDGEKDKSQKSSDPVKGGKEKKEHQTTEDGKRKQGSSPKAQQSRNVKKTKGKTSNKSTNKEQDTRNNSVDVLTMEPVPMFASDSENEAESFAFETRVKNLFHSRLVTTSKGSKGDKNEAD